MEPSTYFTISAILFLISFGALTPVAAVASIAVSAITFLGGIYTKFLIR